MASNRPVPEAPSIPAQRDAETFGYGAYRAEEGPWEEWNPTADSVAPVRGRHRVAKQRGGFARSSTVLGVGVMAAVGAGGMASANTGKPPVSLSLPDMPSVGSPLRRRLRRHRGHRGRYHHAEHRRRGLRPGRGQHRRGRGPAQPDHGPGRAAAGARPRARPPPPRSPPPRRRPPPRPPRPRSRPPPRPPRPRRRRRPPPRRRRREERLARLAKQYALPTSSYTITSTYGQAGSMWSSGHHTGLDFAAPHRHPDQGRPQRHDHRGGLGRRLRLPHHPHPRRRHRDLVLPPVLDQRLRRPEGLHRRGHRPRRRHRQRHRPAPAPGGPPRRPGRRRRPDGLAARQGPQP